MPEDEVIPEVATTEVKTEEPSPEEIAALADKGKQALDRMKEQREAAKAEATAAREELALAKAELAAKAKPQVDEESIDTARREATSAATEVANKRLVRAELKSAAKGVLADPADALVFIDPSKFEVDSDGEVDQAALNDAIASLIEKRPYLAAAQGKFVGTADGGARAPAQKADTVGDLANAALAKGDVKTSIRLKTATLRPFQVTK